MRVETIITERFCPRSVPCHHSSSLFGIIHEKDRVIQRQHMQQCCPRNPGVRDSLLFGRTSRRREAASFSVRYHGISAIESGIGPKKRAKKRLLNGTGWQSAPDLLDYRNTLFQVILPLTNREIRKPAA